MTKAELYEEIRSLLREPQALSVSSPWEYNDTELRYQVRSALRRIKAAGVETLAVMAEDGTLSPEPTEMEGLLIAYFVAHRLLNGDLLRKLMDGEMGIVWKAGSETIDTKTVSIAWQAKAGEYHREYKTLLAKMLSKADVGRIWTGTTFQDR